MIRKEPMEEITRKKTRTENKGVSYRGNKMHKTGFM
jgi:hypothetical protein